MVYAFVVYRRLLSYDDYHLPGNAKPFGYDMSTEYTGGMGTYATCYPSMSMAEPPEPYDPTNPKPPGAARARALSATSLRLSFSSRRESGGSYAAAPQQGPSDSPPLPSQLERPGQQPRQTSYDHRRSTQFDEYVARRLSGGSANLRHSIENALGTEFGWRADDPRDSAISNGTVTSLPVRPTGNSLGRQTSFDASISNVTTSSATITSTNSGTAASTPEEGPSRELSVAHSLVSVPEAHEEDETHPAVAPGRAQGAGAARQSLLGGQYRAYSGAPTRIGTPPRISTTPPADDGLEDVELRAKYRRGDL